LQGRCSGKPSVTLSGQEKTKRKSHPLIDYGVAAHRPRQTPD
jgi:hypothetical protein